MKKLAWFGIGYAVYLSVTNALKLQALEEEMEKLNLKVR